MNKEKYNEFCRENYVPIYSKPWWMDAVCGENNWDVWLYDNGEKILAAMPYYLETRGTYKYITKAPLTQANGIIFSEDPSRKRVTEEEFREKVINKACEFIDSMKLDVYEQQYHWKFDNWSPFFWNNFTCVLRYTYVIEDTTDMNEVFESFSANYRKNIRKGQRNTVVCEDIGMERFYEEHEKVFLKQGIPCPISFEFWKKFYDATQLNEAGKMIVAKDLEGNIHSLMYLVWDEEAMYPILGGYMPEYANSQSYPALTYHSINMAHEKGLKYDFEGSMIQRIAKSFRQFGGFPKPYYRIRKVYNPEIVQKEAEDYIKKIQK